MNKNVFVVALVAFIGCFASTSVLADDPDGYGYYVVAQVTASGGQMVTAAIPASIPDVKPPVLAAVYEGRWFVVNSWNTSVQNSNTTSFRVKSAFQPDSNGEWVATGTYTSYPSKPGVQCGSPVNIPMTIRWNPSKSNRFVLLATPQDGYCPNRYFPLDMDTNGRLSWKSKDGQQSVYFDPDKG